MAFKGGNKINDLSDKTFSIVAASSGGSTGGGSTGGGTGKDPCVGEGAAECGDKGAGGGADDPNVGEGFEESSITITSPVGGQTFETGETVTIAWTATGAAAGNDVCIAISNTNNGQFHGKYDGQFRKKVSKGKVTAKFVNLPVGSYKVRLSVRKKGQEQPPCSPTGAVGDDVVIQHVAPIPVATICGNGVVEGVEVCDFAGVTCIGSGIRSRDYFKPGGDWGRVYPGLWTFNGKQRGAAECSFCNALVAPPRTATNPDNLYYNRDDVQCWVHVDDGGKCGPSVTIPPCLGCTPSQNGLGVCDSFAP